jgi:hypothetical protein
VGTDVYIAGDFLKLDGLATAPFFQRVGFSAGYFDGCAKAETVSSGSWDSPSTWQGGVVPSSNASIVVKHAVSLSRPAHCFSLEIATGGSLQLQATGRVNVVN